MIEMNHTAYQVRKDFTRQRIICNNIGYAIANTLFQKVKFGVRKAFLIFFENGYINQNPIIKLYGCALCVKEKTARLFMLKVREDMVSSSNKVMDGYVNVDEFVLGGREEGKTTRSQDGNKMIAFTSGQLTKGYTVKRIYAMKT